MKLNLKNMVDTLGYEGYEVGYEAWVAETEHEIDQLLGELGAEELGFFKSISKAFKKVVRGVKKVFRKPVKLVKKTTTKAWKLVRRNKRTLTAAGMLVLGKYIPEIKPVAVEYASYQASNLAAKYLPTPTVPTSAPLPEGGPPAPYPFPEPTLPAQPQPTRSATAPKNDVLKAFLPLGMLLVGVYIFGREK